MAFFDWFKRGSLENPSNKFTVSNIWADMFTMSDSGTNVNEKTALNYSAVYAANKILSEDVASLPCKVYKKIDNKIEIASDHDAHYLLHQSPNSFMTPFLFFETAQTYLDLWGNFYARIVRDRSNRPIELIPIHPRKVKSVIKNQLWYEVEGFKNLINSRDMIHVLAFLADEDNGSFRGISPILQGKEVIGNGLALQKFANKFFGSGANLSGILQTDKTLSADAIKRLADAFTSKFAGIDKSHKIGVLEEGLKYTRIGVEPEAAQFLESRRFSVQEIARWFRIPPHMLADLERATFSNIEEQNMSYVRQTLVPWLIRYEQEFNKKLFLPEERKTHYVKFSVDGLLRGDAKTRAEYYSKLFNIGVLSQNDIRHKEELNAIPDGDKYYIPVNMMDNGQRKEDIPQPD